MKTSVVLIASLLGNAALLGVLALRSSPPSAPSSADPRPATASAAPAARGSTAELQAALASGDAAALQAAGVPADVARNLVLGRAFARIAQLARNENVPANGQWWKSRSSGVSREQELAAQRQLSEALIAAFGYDPLFGRADDSRLSFLSPDKRNALRRITQDYDEMFAKFSAGGIQLASDRERLKLLREERDRDLAALLTPAERAEYELRNSPSSASLRARYGDAIESEEDFRKLFALQKAFDEKFSREAMTASGGRVSPEVLQQRAAAERQMQEDMRAALGEEKYAALRRASDGDLRNVESLASRLNLPPSTTDHVAAARDTYALQSQQINANTSLTPQQRREQIQALGGRAKEELARTLGAEAADAYAQRSPWVSMLQGGMAYSTNPKDAPGGGFALGGQSVFPVMPAGATPGGMRSVNIISSDRAAVGAATDGAMFFAPAAPVRIENQVISVTTSDPTNVTPAERRVIVAPSGQQGGTSATPPPRP